MDSNIISANDTHDSLAS